MAENEDNQWPPMPSALLIDCNPKWAYNSKNRLESEETFFWFLERNIECDSLCDIYIGF